MFCHIVPTTYLKSWKVANSEHSIYIFNKTNLQLKGNLKNILNLKGTNFGKVNFFYLKIETCNSRIYDDLFIPILTKIINQKIKEAKSKSQLNYRERNIIKYLGKTFNKVENLTNDVAVQKKELKEIEEDLELNK